MIDLVATRRLVNELRSEYRIADELVKSEKRSLEAVRSDIKSTEQARDILQTICQSVQQKVHERIAVVVSKCLQAVFDEPYEFKILFERKRGKTEARFAFVKYGEEMEAKHSVEGGVIDVAAFALRLACLILSRPQSRRLLVADEPFRFVDAVNRERIRDMLETLSTELQIQFVLVTHDEALQIGKVVEL